MLNRLSHCIKIMVLLYPIFVLSVEGAEIWVSPDGSDKNPGTEMKPKKTVLMALRQARELRRLKDPSITRGITIYLKDGVYRLVEPIVLHPEDSGTSDSPTKIKPAPNAKAILSGGLTIKGWKKAPDKIAGLPKEAETKIWVTDAPKDGWRTVEFRQMWVNNQKAFRASTFDDGDLDRILSVDRENEIIWIPAPRIRANDPSGIEYIIHQRWAIANLRVKNLEVFGDSARVTFWQPESRIQFQHPWPMPFIDKHKNLNGNSAFYFVNAIEFLNQPGEWFEDLDAGKVYYWPRQGENLNSDEVIVPFLESIVQVEGTLDDPVEHIIFDGIDFQHTTWLRPSKSGHVPLQAGMYLYDAYKLPVPGTPDKATLENQAWIGRQPAGMSIKGANNLQIINCRFEHLAATGLDFISGTNHNRVEGCVFKDIGGNAIQVGFFGDESFEAHLPYNPSDERQVCQHETLRNNLINDATNEDWGCVGICVGYAHDITIEHNEVSYVNYSGISVGWGWTKTITCMRNNKIHANNIHHFAQNNYDVGGIYTLSAQPNSEVSENSIHHVVKAPYTHDPKHYHYIYFDEGSSYIRAINNFAEEDKFFSNHPGPGNEWKNNGPNVSEEIKEKAGLEPEYRHLLEKK